MMIETTQDLPLSGGPRVLVPTMGALHAGHAALIRSARSLAGSSGQVVVSVFVNPSQFNQQSDFDGYPRRLADDHEAAIEAGADVVYAPDADEVYPPGVDVPVGELPPLATEAGLEDRFRPGHFAGVQQVVRRLCVLTRPTAACFGEKDWQQLALVRAMVERESLGVSIRAVPTVREPSGLAMSSRNLRLSERGRTEAVAIHRALQEAQAAETPADARVRMHDLLTGSAVRVEYAEVRCARSLAELDPVATPDRGAARALVAGWVDGIRLIDNGPACLGPLPSG